MLLIHLAMLCTLLFYLICYEILVLNYVVLRYCDVLIMDIDVPVMRYMARRDVLGRKSTKNPISYGLMVMSGDLIIL